MGSLSKGSRSPVDTGGTEQHPIGGLGQEVGTMTEARDHLTEFAKTGRKSSSGCASVIVTGLVILTLILTLAPSPAQAHYSTYCGHRSDYGFGGRQRVRWYHSFQVNSWDNSMGLAPGHYHRYWHEYKWPRIDRWGKDHKTYTRCARH